MNGIPMPVEVADALNNLTMSHVRSIDLDARIYHGLIDSRVPPEVPVLANMFPTFNGVPVQSISENVLRLHLADGTKQEFSTLI